MYVLTSILKSTRGQWYRILETGSSLIMLENELGQGGQQGNKRTDLVVLSPQLMPLTAKMDDIYCHKIPAA